MKISNRGHYSLYLSDAKDVMKALFFIQKPVL